MDKSYKAIDLFAGIGGIRLGFEKAGFNIVYSNELDKFCCKTYRSNFNHIDETDICNVDINTIPNFDILLAGFPCQPFSMAGEKNGFDDPRGNLFFQIEKILAKKHPKSFLLENVKFLKSHRKGQTFATIVDILTNKLGYHIYYKILNSKDYGLPQNRERIYIVGFDKNINFKFPKPRNKRLVVKDILEKKLVDEKYFISQKYYECLARHKSFHRAKGNGWGFEVIDKDGVANALVVGRMGRERNLIREQIQAHFYKDGMDKSAKNCLGLRVLTPRECSRLQGFPKSFKIPVSDTQAYRQFGNTVSVPVVTSIAKVIKQYLIKYYPQEKVIKKTIDFDRPLSSLHAYA